MFQPSGEQTGKWKHIAQPKKQHKILIFIRIQMSLNEQIQNIE